MENLVYVLKVMKKYNWYYFIKNALRKNTFRKTLGFFFIAKFFSLITIPILTKSPYVYYIIGGHVIGIFLTLCLIFKLIDNDYKNTINQPLTMKFLNGDYLIFRIHAIKETLQKERLFNEAFLNGVLEECERYLILEANGVSFLLKHPLMAIPVTIISTLLGSLLWELRLHAPLIMVIVCHMTYLIVVIASIIKNRFAQVRTIKFIMHTLKQQMKKPQKLAESYLVKLPTTWTSYNLTR